MRVRQFSHQCVEQASGGGAGLIEADFPVVYQGHQLINLGDDSVLFGEGGRTVFKLRTPFLPIPGIAIPVLAF